MFKDSPDFNAKANDWSLKAKEGLDLQGQGQRDTLLSSRHPEGTEMTLMTQTLNTIVIQYAVYVTHTAI